MHLKGLDTLLTLLCLQGKFVVLIFNLGLVISHSELTIPKLKIRCKFFCRLLYSQSPPCILALHLIYVSEQQVKVTIVYCQRKVAFYYYTSLLCHLETYNKYIISSSLRIIIKPIAPICAFNSLKECLLLATLESYPFC